MRKFIKNSILLYYRTDEQRDIPRKFRIGQMVRQGRLTVSYEAVPENGFVAGKLEEYFPANDIVLDRGRDGQLTASDEFGAAYARFLKERDAFLATYELLQETKNNDAEECPGFIPAFEIYFGYEKNRSREGTVYLFFPDITGEVMTFQDFCDALRRHPQYWSKSSLILALKAIRSLATGVRSLHQVGLLCPGICPQRIGIRKKGLGICPDAVLLDTMDVCSVFDAAACTAGPIGFSAPGLLRRGAGIETDLYGIGCMLFYALTGILYWDENYGLIKQMVFGSQIVASCGEQISQERNDSISDILQKSLSGKYRNCEEMISDIERVLDDIGDDENEGGCSWFQEIPEKDWRRIKP